MLKQILKSLAIFSILVFAIAMMIVPVIAFGQTAGPGPCDPTTTVLSKDGKRCEIKNPAGQYLLNIDNFPDLIVRIITIFLYFSGAIALVFLIIGGFQYIAARGNEEATEKAKKTISGAILGIVIIIMSFALVTIVNNLVLKGPV